MGKKFVGLGGLKHFWTKAKTWIAGQITAEVTAKIAEIVANAPEDLDSLKEIADWISTHANDASAMNTQINTNKSDIAALQTSVAGKAEKIHTHDDRYFTETEVTNKLAGKSDTGHTHTKSQITDFPTSLPANGGTASKVANSLTFGSKTYNGSSAQTITASDLGALTAHQTIKQDGITGATVNRFGTCSTAAATAAKTVSITDGTFSLEAGARVSVKFSNANTADTPTLDVANKGAKNIFHKGAKITTGVNKALLAGVCDFIYDGTQWHLIGNYIDTNTTYSAATQSSAGLMSADDKTKLDNLEKYTKEYKVSDVTSETTKYIKLGEFNPTEGGNISCRITGDNFDDTIDINILGGNLTNTSVCGHYSTKSKRTQGIRISGTISQNIGIYLKISQLTTATVKVAVDKKYQSRITMSESGLGQYEGVLTDISFSSYNGLFGNLTGDVTGNVTGSSGSASKLTTARTAYVDLGIASTTRTIDWSGDTTIPVDGVLQVEHGGTGANTARGAADSLIANLPASDNVPVDTDYFISQIVNGGPFVPGYERRPISKLWEYIKGKISSVLGLTKDNYSGKADTAGTADTAVTADRANQIVPNYTSKALSEVSSNTIKYIKVAECGWSQTGTLQVFLGGDCFHDTLVLDFGGGDGTTPMLCGHYSGNSRLVFSVIAQKGSAWNSNYSIYVKLVQKTTCTVQVALLKGDCTINITESTTAPTNISEWPVNYGLFGTLTGNVTGNVSGSSGSCTGNSATADKAGTADSATTAGTATTAAKLGRSGDTGIPMTFNWSGQVGQPNWLWGGNDGSNMYVYNPSNFSVNTANIAYKIRTSAPSNPSNGDIWIQ